MYANSGQYYDGLEMDFSIPIFVLTGLSAILGFTAASPIGNTVYAPVCASRSSLQVFKYQASFTWQLLMASAVMTLIAAQIGIIKKQLKYGLR